MNFPLKSEKSTRMHRQAKRHAEIVRILAETEIFLKSTQSPLQNLKILEFGCGNGFQIPYLKKLGQVFATDIYSSDEMAIEDDLNFCESDINQLPFSNNTFDIIFSNHVVEHLPDPHQSFLELNRVAKKECIFIFSVPTNVWLVLALPAKYLGKLRTLINNLIAHLKNNSSGTGTDQDDIEKRQMMEKKFSTMVHEKPSLMRSLLPKGHGVHHQFKECYKAFSIMAWTDFFRQAGFAIHSVVPLLLYGPSERPIIPTSSWMGRYGLCSSVLFIMGKKECDSPPSCNGSHVS